MGRFFFATVLGVCQKKPKTVAQNPQPLFFYAYKYISIYRWVGSWVVDGGAPNSQLEAFLSFLRTGAISGIALTLSNPMAPASSGLGSVSRGGTRARMLVCVRWFRLVWIAFLLLPCSRSFGGVRDIAEEKESKSEAL